jgi:hypothetical protein
MLLFVSQRTGSHSAGILCTVPPTNCFVHRWFYAVHGPKPPLHRHNWLSFGKVHDTTRSHSPCPRHLSSLLPLAVKRASTPRHLGHKKTFEEILYLLICSFLLCLSWLLRSRVRDFQRDLRITLYKPSFKDINLNVWSLTLIVSSSHEKCGTWLIC